MTVWIGHVDTHSQIIDAAKNHNLSCSNDCKSGSIFSFSIERLERPLEEGDEEIVYDPDGVGDF